MVGDVALTGPPVWQVALLAGKPDGGVLQLFSNWRFLAGDVMFPNQRRVTMERSRSQLSGVAAEPGNGQGARSYHRIDLGWLRLDPRSWRWQTVFTNPERGCYCSPAAEVTTKCGRFSSLLNKIRFQGRRT